MTIIGTEKQEYNRILFLAGMKLVFATDGNAYLIWWYVGSKQYLFKGCRLFFSQEKQADSREFSPPSGYYLHPAFILIRPPDLLFIITFV